MRALWAARWRRTTHIAAGGATWGWQKGSNRSGRGRCRASQPSQAPHGLPSPAASPRARAPRPTRGHQAARRAAQTSRSGMQTASKQVSVHSSSRRGARPRSRRRVPLAGRGRTRPRMPARASARARLRHAATARTRRGDDASRATAPGGASSADLAADAGQLFRLLVGEGGLLQLDKLASVTADLNLDFSQEDLRHMISLFDSNGQGVLGLDDFTAIVRAAATA
mmetsp:Transcript_44698/g.145244  ORF Transcript_44698/g.145244 Transcript_44698/m.145244 type:complete len:225 (-) Transcript_44698:206-880(-)